MANSRLRGKKQGGKIDGKLKCAVFGTGYWSTLQIPAWLETEEVEIIAVYNRTREKGETVARRFGINRVYDDAEKLMEKEDFDFADIITEAPGHEWLTRLAAKHVIPVICQKPMSDSFESCNRMINSCRDADVPFFIHENYRWQIPIREVKKAFQKDCIGRLVRARIQLLTGGALAFQLQPYLCTLDYPILQDMGPHLLDLCRFLFGEIESVCVQTIRTIEGLKGDDTAVILANAGGIPVTCAVTTYCDSRIYVEGEKGTITLDNEENLTITTDEGIVDVQTTRNWPRYAFCSDQDWELHGGSSIHSIVLCNRSFADAFRSGTLPETSGEDNFKTMSAVFACIRSVQENRKVFIKEMV